MIPVETPCLSLRCILAALLVLLGCMGYMFTQDRMRTYRKHQADFRDLIAEKFGPEKAAAVETGIRQIWRPEIGVTDRCTTCHMGIGWENLGQQQEPHGQHPIPGLIQKHPFDRFGCTPCHGGQGLATAEGEAHQWFKQGLFPPPPANDGGGFRPKVQRGLLEIRCNFCHRHQQHVDGMPLLNHGKQLVEENGCRDCHTINGAGGTVGPDLTHEGDRPPALFNFSPGSARPQSVFTWHMEHFYYPRSARSTSIMPQFRFTPRDLQALSLLVMSWKKNMFPLDYHPQLRRPDALTESHHGNSTEY